MKAILIPANSSEPVREIDFDQDKSWRYVVRRYDPSHPWDARVAILTKENAPRDYPLRNTRASEYVQDNLAARDRTDGPDSPENLYGDVVVLGYDKAVEKLTDVPEDLSPEDFEPFAGLGAGELPRVDIGDDDDPTQDKRAVPVRGSGMDPKHARAQIDEYEAGRDLEAERNPDPARHLDPPGRDPYERGGAPYQR